jgi:glycosyltransferase involved in cell wall biosynthesis
LNISFLAGTLEHGGAERQLFYMLEALRQRGAAPRVLCLDRGQFWEAAIRSLGVPVAWVGQRQSRLARWMRVLKELLSHRPEVLQSQHFFANVYVGMSARLLRLCDIGAIRNETAAELRVNGRIGGWLNLHLPRFIAANSLGAIRQAAALGLSPSRLHFLPNVVDTWQFKPASTEGGRPLTLLCVGRIVKEKGFDRFIAALGRLRSELKLDVRGWIAGPTQNKDLRQKLEAQADALALWPDRLQFLGSVSNMAPIYQEADVCVLTSEFEGTPNVLLEAMACGLPVVASRVGGVPDIVVEGESGYLVDPGDADALTAALAEVVRNDARRKEMGRRAREFVEANHSLERLPSYLQKLYDKALEQQGPSTRRTGQVYARPRVPQQHPQCYKP